MRLDIRCANTKTLCNFKAGETFLYDKRYFMVTDEKISENIKCVDLERGIICSISDLINVIPVKLVVHRDETE